MWKNFLLALVCSLVSILFFFRAGVHATLDGSSIFAVPSLLGSGFVLLGFAFRYAVKDYVRRNPKESIPTELNPKGFYQVCDVFETKASADKWFFLFLFDIKKREELVFRVSSVIPPGFKEVKTVSGTFLIPEKEEETLYLLHAVGARTS